MNRRPMSSLAVTLAPSRFLDPMLLLLVVLGVALHLAFRGAPAAGRRPRLGRVAAWMAWGALWALSTPLVANRLSDWTETRGPDLDAALAGRDLDRTALVVLAGGLRTVDPEVPARERLDGATTQRVLTAARLWHRHRFGVVILSGSPAVETEGMSDLITTLGVPAERLVRETKSVNTRENARYSAVILHDRGVETTVMVTSATHLRRAVKDFEAVGVHVIPAAADVVGLARVKADSLLPAAGALGRTQIALHELLGYVRG
jgi:uncharacterized SAM-binding protein YcdF (DUF218 family)